MTATGFTCDRCGHCCRHHRVPVTLDDVARLLSAESPISEFVELLDVSSVDMTDEPETVVQVREGAKVIALKHARAAETGSGCVFLDANGSCKRHFERPRSCRSYPFDRPEPNETTRLGLHPERLCPDATGVLITLRGKAHEDPQVQKFNREIEERDREASSHAEWIQSWNRRQRIRVKLGRTPLDSETLLTALAEAASMKTHRFVEASEPSSTRSQSPE